MTFYNKIEQRGLEIGLLAGIFFMFCLIFMALTTEWLHGIMLPAHPILASLLFICFWFWFILRRANKTLHACLDLAERIIDGEDKR